MRIAKWTVGLLALAMLLGVAALLFREFVFGGFPSPGYVNAFFEEYPAMQPDDRQRRTEALFTKLSSDESASDVALSASAFRRFAELYRRTQDENLLAGLDQVWLDGAFHADVCSLYQQLSSEPGFARRYRKGARAALRIWQCVGQIPEEQVVRLVGPYPGPDKNRINPVGRLQSE